MKSRIRCISDQAGHKFKVTNGEPGYGGLTVTTSTWVRAIGHANAWAAADMELGAIPPCS